MSALCATVFAQVAVQVEVGKTVVIEIPVQAKAACNVDVYLAGQKMNIEVDANQKTAKFSYQGLRVGEETIRWEGATKFRGLKTLFGCQGSGAVSVRTIEDQAKLKAEAAMAEARRLQQELAQRDREDAVSTTANQFEKDKQADIAALDAQLRALESRTTRQSNQTPAAATESHWVNRMSPAAQFGQPQVGSAGKGAPAAEVARQLNAAHAFSLSKTRGAYFLDQNAALIGQGDPSGQKLQKILFEVHNAWIHSLNNWNTYTVLRGQASAQSNVTSTYEKISLEQKRQAMAYAKEFYETWSAMPDDYKATFVPGGAQSGLILVDNTFVNEQFVVKILLDEFGAISEISGRPHDGRGDSVGLLAGPYSKSSQGRN